LSHGNTLHSLFYFFFVCLLKGKQKKENKVIYLYINM
jgi:hypothetical protein